MTGRLTRICRHPIKGHGREDLASVVLSPGEGLPFDRHWAVAHEAARLVPGWNQCVNFMQGARAPALMAITAVLDEDRREVVLTHPEAGSLTLRPDDSAALAGFLDWVRPLTPPERAAPARIVAAGRPMTDTDYVSVSLLSRASLADLSQRMGMDLSEDRWRGNFWLDGAEPWAEFTWIGREIRIGEAVLRIEERITRCKATTVNPETGKIEGDTLAALSSAFGHKDFGVYARVIKGGSAAKGDGWALA